ncbi:MAG: trypsin-like peptidase domain-containing protein [Holophagaceae bacterium]
MRLASLKPLPGLLTVLLAVFRPGFAQPRPPTATNRLFLHAKPAVVRIYAGYAGKWSWGGQMWRTVSVGSGSGFFISPDGYLLTNAHVVSDIRDGDQAGKRTLLFQLAVQALRSRGLAVNNQSVVQAAGVLANQAYLSEFQRVNVVVLQSGRRFPFEIKAYGAPSGQATDLATGKDVAVLKIEAKNTPTLHIGNSDGMQVGDKVYVMGYPGAADSSLLDARSSLEPTINDGAISAKKTSADGAPILQTSTSATHGNSGGPVLNEKGEAIGLLTFRGDTVNGQEVQGFNFIVPTSTAQEFVRAAGVENRESPVDGKWRQGLDYYWEAEYRNAKEEFGEILALNADHAEAAKLAAECQERIVKGEDRSGLKILGWMGALGCGFVVVVVGGVILLVLMLRKKKAPAARPAGQPPVPAGAEPQPRAQPHVQAARPAAGPARTEVFKAGPASGRLVCLAGPLLGREFPIGEGIYLGRDAARAQIVVPDAQVSGQHLWVGPLAGRAIARDAGSTNGTFLNGRMDARIGDAELKDGDVLTLGGAGTIRFQYRA